MIQIRAKKFIWQLRSTMMRNLGIVRNQTSILKGLTEIIRIEREARGLSAKLNDMILVSKFIAQARECVSTGAAGAQTRRSLGHRLILRLLVLCAPAVLRPRALQDALAPADPNS